MLQARVLAGGIAELLNQPLAYILDNDDRFNATIIKARAGISIRLAPLGQLPFLRNGVVVNIFQLLAEKCRSVDVLGLHGLPDLMLRGAIWLTLRGEEFQLLYQIIDLQLLHNCMRRERAKRLKVIGNCPAFNWLGNSMKVRGHDDVRIQTKSLVPAMPI